MSAIVVGLHRIELSTRCKSIRNGDDATNVSDASYLLNHLFAGGPAPAQPFPDCGPGMLPADAELGCANPPNCQ